jgi:ceramide glucosyltransferase
MLGGGGRSSAGAVIHLIVLACAVTVLYQLTALVACLRHLRRRQPTSNWTPGVSVLKPVKGVDPLFEEAVRSHAAQDYPEFEILFAVSDEDDPAVTVIQRIKSEYPGAAIRIVTGRTPAANGKVALLIDAAREAKHRILLANDSDILVPPDYLRTVVAPLEDPECALVTCLYRAKATSLAGRWEALGIAADFAPSVLVAALVGVREFGLGATLVFRAEDLKRIGGFEAIADYLADDYQLAKRLTQLGGRAVISTTIVETSLGGSTWAEVWRHQVRWARTIRVSRGGGYRGLPVTHSGVWALAAAALGCWPLALGVSLVRIATGWVAGWMVLGSPVVRRAWSLIPLWDLWAFAVWVAGSAGHTVEWRGRKLRIAAGGRIGGWGSEAEKGRV